MYNCVYMHYHFTLAIANSKLRYNVYNILCPIIICYVLCIPACMAIQKHCGNNIVENRNTTIMANYSIDNVRHLVC